MRRYIDADKLYESMQWNIQHDMYDKPFDYLAEIDSQPTADVRENVRGEWIENKKTERQHQLIFYKVWTCSQCGEQQIRFKGSNFCPNCGADMRGEKQ